MNYREQLEHYQPIDEDEAAEKQQILWWITQFSDKVLLRECPGHLTASAFVVNHDASKLLFAYHNIYDAWAWLGGHADGETDMLAVAARELEEESGIHGAKPLTGELDSVEILPVWLHEKRGVMVATHLHLNYSYLFIADDTQALYSAPEENQAVAWIPAEQMMEYSGEKEMERTYQKLLHKAKRILQEKRGEA